MMILIRIIKLPVFLQDKVTIFQTLLVGFHRNGYDSQGYDRFGLDKSGYDRDGFNLLGNSRQGEYDGIIDYNEEGYDEEGFNR